MSGLLQRYKRFIKQLTKVKKQNKKPKALNLEKHLPNYFIQASSWATDFQTHMVLSRNRYRVAFIISLLLSCLLVLALCAVLPLEHFQPLLIHHYEDGVISVDPIKKNDLPQSKALVESEITRYIQARESYDPSSYSSQYQLVNLMSDTAVFRSYQREQSSDNPQSNINTLGNKFIRQVRIESIVFLNLHKAKSSLEIDDNNLAEVNFSTIDINNSNGKRIVSPFVATMSWKHLGIPHDPQLRWRNWDGFVVSDYQLVQRSVTDQ
jgi:type IV secretion system protein VirB8